MQVYLSVLCCKDFTDFLVTTSNHKYAFIDDFEVVHKVNIAEVASKTFHEAYRMFADPQDVLKTLENELNELW